MIEPQESRVQKIEDLIDIRDALDLFENDFADHQAYPEVKQTMKSKTSKMNGATKEMTDGDLTHNDLWEAFRVRGAGGGCVHKYTGEDSELKSTH